MNSSKIDKLHRKGDVSYVGATSKSNTPTPHSSAAPSPAPHGTPRATPISYEYDSQSLSSIHIPGPFESHMSHGGRIPVPHLGLISTPTHTPVPHVSYSSVQHSVSSNSSSHHASSSNQHPAEKLWDQRPVSYPPAPQHSGLDSDWEAREEIRQRELEEARARAAQMEKTMRWWSDCTANWREKWSKVRNERNKAREECRHLRSKLEAALNEITAIKRDKFDLEVEKSDLKKQLQNIPPERDPTCVKNVQQIKSPAERDLEHSQPAKTMEPSVDGGGDAASTSSGDKQDVSEVAEPPKKSLLNDIATEVASNNVISPVKDETVDETLINQKVAAVELKLEEAQKTIQAERDEKSQLGKQMDDLQRDLSGLKLKYDDMKKSNQESQLQLSKLRDEHEHELGRISQELEDESCSRYNMDKTISDLRKELERLQAENAAEWGKRERLETEKISLERENKKLRHQISEMEENIGKRSKMSLMDNDMKIVQQDLHDRNKELADLKHCHNKTKKVLQEKTTELDHARRRAEQYEIEVKKLRSRVEELRKDLATAEDEVDHQSNNVRRLHRTNEELQEQMEGLQVQLEHSKSRLRRAEGSLPRSASLKSFDLINTPDVTETETDDEPL